MFLGQCCVKFLNPLVKYTGTMFTFIAIKHFTVKTYFLAGLRNMASISKTETQMADEQIVITMLKEERFSLEWMQKILSYEETEMYHINRKIQLITKQVEDLAKLEEKNEHIDHEICRLNCTITFLGLAYTRKLHHSLILEKIIKEKYESIKTIEIDFKDIIDKD